MSPCGGIAVVVVIAIGCGMVGGCGGGGGAAVEMLEGRDLRCCWRNFWRALVSSESLAGFDEPELSLLALLLLLRPPECVRRCCSMLSLRVKPLPHSGQMASFLPVCFLA